MLRSDVLGFLRRAAVLLAALALTATAVAQTRSGQVQPSGSDVCCLNNFRYTGTCEVTVGSGESCSSVLSYLNNLNSAGRQYCGNTIIRGGWTLVRCGSGGGPYASPGTVTTVEPSRAPATAPVQQVRPTSPGSTSGGGATFITPVEPSREVQATEPGLINL